eukprot:GHVP01004428.1.p1 GENE.GHVP01004428.1~~GHVP01004428.1.p1  ORF type:complete len:164 (-),score=37.81 GHVP01004428.1:306-797(-)
MSKGFTEAEIEAAKFSKKFRKKRSGGAEENEIFEKARKQRLQHLLDGGLESDKCNANDSAAFDILLKEQTKHKSKRRVSRSLSSSSVSSFDSVKRKRRKKKKERKASSGSESDPPPDPKNPLDQAYDRRAYSRLNLMPKMMNLLTKMINLMLKCQNEKGKEER